MAVSGAASRGGSEGPGLHRRADRFHLQRHVRRRADSRASLTPSRRAATSRGSARACSAAAPTTTAASRSAWPTTISSRRSTDGLGFDWPISYEDLAPYYDKAERFIGVTGTTEGIRSAPDGIFNPPAALRAHDVLVQRACAKHGIRAVAARQAVTTVARNGRPRVPLLRTVRPRLHDGLELRRQLRPDLSRRCRPATCRSSPTRWRAS